MKSSRNISRLVEIMAALRTPGSGCPWDLQQDFSTIAPYTIEEAYEVADAIDRGDMADLKLELGDLLLQPVYHARMAEEAGLFDFGDVVEAITGKMIRRHPHVFGDDDARSAGMAKGHWDRIKAQEEKGRSSDPGDETGGFLDSVPSALPGLMAAVKLQAKASRVGFDWNDAACVIKKIREELDEVEDALTAASPQKQAEEIGDLLFAVANLARHLQLDPDGALRKANAKFRKRFRHIEEALKRKAIPLDEASLEQMEELWQEAKLTPHIE